MEVEKIIESVGKDGKKVLSNILNKNTGKYLEYKEVDGVTDQDVIDGKNPDLWDVYIKYKDGKYYIMSEYLDKDKLFLEKDSIAEVRAMSTSEILLLKIGYYKGVRVNGYYEKGDTPAPIEYFISNTDKNDNGGSVIEVSNVKMEHNFNCYYISSYYGVMSNIPDNTDQINNLLHDVEINTSIIKTIEFPESEGFIQSKGGHNVPSNTNVLMYAELRDISDPSTPSTYMTISYNGASTRLNHIININRGANNLANFESEEKVGVVFRNHRNCVIDIKSVRRFNVGVKFLGEDTSTVFNNVTLGRLLNNHIHIKMRAVGTGWVNENTFIGGSLNKESSLNGYIQYGFHFESDSSVFSNNRIIGTAFEGDRMVGAYMHYARRNKFTNVRWEVPVNGVPTDLLVFAIEDTETSFGNEYLIGSRNINSPIKIRSVNGSAISRSVIKLMEGNNLWYPKLLVSTGNLTQYVRETSLKYHTILSPFYTIAFSTGERSSNYENNSSFVVNKDSVDISSRGLATTVSLEDTRVFLLSVELAKEGSVSGINIIPYDSNGDVITSSGAVTGSSVNATVNQEFGTFNNTAFGGSFQTTTGNKEITLGFSDDVAYFVIILRGVGLKGWSLFSADISKSINLYSELPFVSTNVKHSVEVSSNYEVTLKDDNILVDTTNNPVTITLPNLMGKIIRVLHVAGNASSNNVTIIRRSSNPFIDGSTSKVINTNFGTKTFASIGRGSGNIWGN